MVSNHENHDALDAYPVEFWNGGKVHKISDSIIHLMRGQIFTIEGKKFFTMGGAESHDKIYRKEGISWWPREMPSNDEYEEGLANLDKVNNQVDYILSHCAPDQLQSQIAYWYEHDKLTGYLEIVRQTVKFGQLISNLGRQFEWTPGGFFYMEDEEFMDTLEGILARLNRYE